MRKRLALIPALFLLAIFGCCSECQLCIPECPPSPQPKAQTVWPKHPEFTPANISRLKLEMKMGEIISIFGPPDRSSANTLESKVNMPFRELTFEYEMTQKPKAKYPEYIYINKFVFNAEQDPPVLKRWEIEFTHEPPPPPPPSATPVTVKPVAPPVPPPPLPPPVEPEDE